MIKGVLFASLPVHRKSTIIFLSNFFLKYTIALYGIMILPLDLLSNILVDSSYRNA